MTPPYSRLQVILGKTLALVLAALVCGPFMAKTSDQRLTMIAGVFLLLVICVAAYEGLAHGIAVVLGRLAPPREEPGKWVTATNRIRIPIDVLEAGKILAWFIGAQIAVWSFAVAWVLIGSHRPAGTPVSETLVSDLVPIALPAGLAASTLALVLVLRRWRNELGPVAFDWVMVPSSGTVRQLLLGLGTGTALGALYLVASTMLSVRATGSSLISQAIATPGPSRWALVLGAVLLAPPLEEAMFRGAMLGALRESWGLTWAAIASGLVFWLLHATEWVRYWPAAVSIGLLTVVLTVLRIRTRSLGPCIAAHVAYNGVLMAVVLNA